MWFVHMTTRDLYTCVSSTPSVNAAAQRDPIGANRYAVDGGNGSSPPLCSGGVPSYEYPTFVASLSVSRMALNPTKPSPVKLSIENCKLAVLDAVSWFELRRQSVNDDGFLRQYLRTWHTPRLRCR